MLIERVVFENFRNFEGLDLSLSQGFVVLVGPNSAGKTNFLEGIYFGSNLGHFPESKRNQLFRDNSEFLKVKLWIEDGDGKTQEVFLERQGKGLVGVLKVDNQRVSRGQYGDIFPVIAFLPQDMILLVRSPSNRRRFLNETLSNVSREYRKALLDYGRALKQRNSLWEKITAGQEQENRLLIWDEPLAEFGSILTKERKVFLDFANENIGQILGEFFPSLKGVQFFYRKSGGISKEEFLEKLQALRGMESGGGGTLIGPHLDDFLAMFKDREAAGYFSRGQIRALTLALKIIEREYIYQKRNKSPILLLDDVFSEFDRTHQESLIRFLKTFSQVFITSTHLESAISSLAHDGKIFRMEQGRIV